MTVHCKKCEQKFYSISTLRRHQWRDHREIFANTGKRETALVVVKPIEPSINTPEMTARALLQKVKNQAEFMHDVVNLLEGIIK